MSKNNGYSSLKKAAAISTMIAVPAIAHAQEAQTSKIDVSPSSLEWHFADGNDKARINLFYNLPLNTSAYSFMEFYGKGGYFGKDMLYTPILKKQGIGAKIETSHALFAGQGEGCDFAYNQIGMGLEKQAMLPGNIFASLKFLPFEMGNDGMKNREMVIGYFASKAIPINDNIRINISSFLDFRLGKQRGPVSDYGETDATLEIKTRQGQIDLATGYNHNVSGKLAPDNQFRVRVGYHPKK